MPVLSYFLFKWALKKMLLKLLMYLHFTHSVYPEFPVQEEECSKIRVCLNLYLRDPRSVQCPVNLTFSVCAAFVSQHSKPHLLSDGYFFPFPTHPNMRVDVLSTLCTKKKQIYITAVQFSQNNYFQSVVSRGIQERGIESSGSSSEWFEQIYLLQVL